jgi:hypothetical protein
VGTLDGCGGLNRGVGHGEETIGGMMVESGNKLRGFERGRRDGSASFLLEPSDPLAGGFQTLFRLVRTQRNTTTRELHETTGKSHSLICLYVANDL